MIESVVKPSRGGSGTQSDRGIYKHLSGDRATRLLLKRDRRPDTVGPT